jgi:small-conductance mechanosensitive channel
MHHHGHGLRRFGVVLMVLMVFGLAQHGAGLAAWAQTDPSPPASPTDTDASPIAAPLVVGEDTIVVFRSSVAGVVPARRAEIARQRLDTIRPPAIFEPIRTDTIPGGRIVLIGDAMAFMVMDTDVEPQSHETSRDVAERAAQELHEALARRALLLKPGQRLRGLIESIVATFVLIGLLAVERWGHHRLLAWMKTTKVASAGRLKVGDVDVLDRLSIAGVWLLRIAVNILGLVLVGFWAVFVLNRFAETQRWGLQARWFLRDTLESFQAGILHSVPGVVAAGLVVIIGYFVSKLSAEIFLGIERGNLRILGVHPETAGATRRLVNTLIWLFTVVIAYPFLPGSDSEVFKGISVFLGILITLGSTGVVGHMMSGLVLVYSRALKPGDMVHVADIEGMVLEVGALSTKLSNFRNEEFTIPNTVMVSSTVKNYSRLAQGQGTGLTTAISIGYGAPWRVVHELLLTAAARTKGIRKDPAPIVLQASLSDFFVEYELIVRLERHDQRVPVRNLLNQNIQDAFNERGVQIMSPHFEGQPDHPIMVPKSKWSEAPLDPKGSGGA